MPKKKPAAWANRIVSSGVQPAGQFLAHPDNWRIHPGAQEEALIGILDRVGWVQDVIVSQRTGYTLDGHLRVASALRRGEETPVPYKVVDVTEAEEALLLASLDPIAALAGTDNAKYEELVGLLPDDLAVLAKLAKGSAETAKTLVQFTAQEKHTVVVECADAQQQRDLLSRLTQEGYTCRHGR